MDPDRRNVDGRSGNRRSAEDPTLLIGRAAVEAVTTSPLVANLRMLSTRIVKGMERPLSQSAVRTARSSFLLYDAGPVLSVFELHVYSWLEPFRRAGRRALEVGELIRAIDAFQRGQKDDLWRWVEERTGSAPDTILAARFSKDVPPIADAGARTMLAFTKVLVKGHKIRLGRRGEATVVNKRSAELRQGIKGRYPSVEYALSRLAREGETPDDVLRNELPGESFVQATELSPERNLAGATASGIRRWIERPDYPWLVTSTPEAPDRALRQVDESELAAFAMRELLERCANDAGLSQQEAESFFFGALFGNNEAAEILNRPAGQIGVEKFRARQKLRAAADL
jgi:hypothetical protein